MKSYEKAFGFSLLALRAEGVARRNRQHAFLDAAV